VCDVIFVHVHADLAEQARRIVKRRYPDLQTPGSQFGEDCADEYLKESSVIRELRVSWEPGDTHQSGNLRQALLDRLQHEFAPNSNASVKLGTAVSANVGGLDEILARKGGDWSEPDCHLVEGWLVVYGWGEVRNNVSPLIKQLAGFDPQKVRNKDRIEDGDQLAKALLMYLQNKWWGGFARLVWRLARDKHANMGATEEVLPPKLVLSPANPLTQKMIDVINATLQRCSPMERLAYLNNDRFNHDHIDLVRLLDEAKRIGDCKCLEPTARELATAPDIILGHLGGKTSYQLAQAALRARVKVERALRTFEHRYESDLFVATDIMETCK